MDTSPGRVKLPVRRKVKGFEMRIGEIATKAGVPSKTIRFWEDQRLLPKPDRIPAGYRDYDAEILERLAFIRHAQVAGLTLEQIRQVLDIRSNGEAPCVHVTAAVNERLAEVESRIAELKRTRNQLRDLAKRAAAQDPVSQS